MVQHDAMMLQTFSMLSSRIQNPVGHIVWLKLTRLGRLCVLIDLVRVATGVSITSLAEFAKTYKAYCLLFKLMRSKGI